MESQMLDLIKELVRDVWDTDDAPPPADLGVESPLLGPAGILSSMALVSLLMGLEQEIEERFDVTVRLVDERAMSHRSSPFRTVGSLADYAAQLVREAN